jgi:hypothetical protein
MSLYVMARKARERDIARNINAVLPFALNRSNTGRFETSCGTANPKAAAPQTGYNIRMKQITTTKNKRRSWSQMPDKTPNDFLTRKASAHITCDISENVTTATSKNANCSTSNTAAATRTIEPTGANGCCFQRPYRKSLDSTVNRLKKCMVTKPITNTVAASASDKIRRVKAAVNNCIEANPTPLSTSKCTPTA